PPVADRRHRLDAEKELVGERARVLYAAIEMIGDRKERVYNEECRRDLQQQQRPRGGQQMMIDVGEIAVVICLVFGVDAAYRHDLIKVSPECHWMKYLAAILLRGVSDSSGCGQKADFARGLALVMARAPSVVAPEDRRDSALVLKHLEDIAQAADRDVVHRQFENKVFPALGVDIAAERLSLQDGAGCGALDESSGLGAYLPGRTREGGVGLEIGHEGEGAVDAENRERRKEVRKRGPRRHVIQHFCDDRVGRGSEAPAAAIDEIESVARYSVVSGQVFLLDVERIGHVVDALSKPVEEKTRVCADVVADLQNEFRIIGIGQAGQFRDLVIGGI